MEYITLFIAFFILNLMSATCAHAHASSSHGTVTFSGAISTPTCSWSSLRTKSIEVSCLLDGKRSSILKKIGDFNQEDNIISSSIEYAIDDSMEKVIMTLAYN